jgi:hypothetical protein
MKARVPRSRRKTSHIVSSSGRVGNEHFLLIADHLLLEVDPASFELVSAFAEGNVVVHLLDEGQAVGCQVLAKSGIYYPQRQRVILSGWEETRYNGLVETAPASMQQEAVLPTDGSFLRPVSSAERYEDSKSRESALAAA